MNARRLFFEDLAEYIDHWSHEASSALLNDEADLVWTENPDGYRQLRTAIQAHGIDAETVRSVFSDVLIGLADSYLLILDGATKLAEQTRIHLVDNDGNSLGEALSEGFFDYLSETKRPN